MRESNLSGSIKPNLFIIGAMKSGTHLLHEALNCHHSIIMSAIKEPSYFVEPSQLRTLQLQLWNQGYCDNKKRYTQLFVSTGNEIYAGESSVYYTHLPLATGVAERIKRFNPDARLLYIMRDPIERTISHYWHRVVHNDEYRPLQQAIEEDNRYRDVSYYAMQLTPFLTLFDRSQLKTFTLEEFIENHCDACNSIFNWLGIDTCTDIPPLRQINTGPDIIKLEARWWSILHEYMRRHDLDQTLTNAIRYLPARVRAYGAAKTGRLVRRSEISTEGVVRLLKPLQRDQTRELSVLLGRKFPEWRTLNS